MAGLAQTQFPVVGYDGHSAYEIQSRLSLCHKKIKFSKKHRSIKQIRQIGTQKIGKFSQNAHYFPLFRKFEFTYFIVQFHDFGRFNECSLAGCGFVIYEPGYFLLIGGTHRNEHLAVTYSHRSPVFRYSLFLCPAQDDIDPLGNGALLIPEGFAYVVEFIRGCVLDFRIAVQNAVYAPGDFREGNDSAGHLLQIWIDSFLDTVEKENDFAKGFQHRLEFAEGEQVYGDGRFFKRLEKAQAINIPVGWKTFLKHKYEPHLIGEFQTPAHLLFRRREFLFANPVRGIFRQALCGDDIPYLVKSQLMFQNCIHSILLAGTLHRTLTPDKLTESLTEQQFQFIQVVDMGPRPVIEEGDTTRLFRHHHDFRIRFFSNPGSSLVPHSELRGQSSLTHRKSTSGRYNTFPVNDYCPVVQRRILEEEIHQQPAVHHSINPVSGVYDAFQRGTPGKHYQSTCFGRGHRIAGFGNFLNHG